MGFLTLLGLLIAVAVVISFCYGIVCLRRHRVHRSRSSLLLGIIFTGIIPGILIYLLHRDFEPVVTTLIPFFQQETLDDSGAVSSCYSYGGIAVIEYTGLQKLHRRWLRWEMRHHLSAEVNDLLATIARHRD